MSQRSRKAQLEERLTADQIKAAYMLLDNELKAPEDRLTMDEIADACNTTRMSLYRWRTRSRDFADFRREIIHDYMSDISGLFFNSLKRSMAGTNGAPSMKALELYAKIEGLVGPDSKVDVNIGAGGRDSEDLESELERLDEQLAELEGTDDKEGDR